jgi:hypothetical protein
MAAAVSRLGWQPPAKNGQTRTTSSRLTGRVGSYVFVEAKLPARSDHAVQISQHRVLVGDRAEHERGHARVEGRILKGERATQAVHDRDRDGPRRARTRAETVRLTGRRRRRTNAHRPAPARGNRRHRARPLGRAANARLERRTSMSKSSCAATASTATRAKSTPKRSSWPSGWPTRPRYHRAIRRYARSPAIAA